MGDAKDWKKQLTIQVDRYTTATAANRRRQSRGTNTRGRMVARSEAVRSSGSWTKFTRNRHTAKKRIIVP